MKRKGIYTGGGRAFYCGEPRKSCAGIVVGNSTSAFVDVLKALMSVFVVLIGIMGIFALIAYLAQGIETQSTTSQNANVSSAEVIEYSENQETTTPVVATSDQETAPAEEYYVTKVVDGDTIYVEKDGTSMKIRFIGVNTPEVYNGAQCYGSEASAFAKQMLNGRWVGLEADSSQDNTDKYGRYLRYVYVDGRNFNRELIAQGYGFEYTYRVAYKYQSEFRAAEDAAEAGGIGLWSPSTCNGELRSV